MSVYIVNLLQILKKCLIMISPKHRSSDEGNVIDFIYVGELKIHTVFIYHCATYRAWPGPLLIVLYVAPNLKGLDTPALQPHK